MASSTFFFFFFFFFSFLLLLSLSSAATVPLEIVQACKATRSPATCETSLSQSGNVTANPSPLQIIQSGIWITAQNLKTAQTTMKTILDSSAGNRNRTKAAKNCIEFLSNSQYRTSLTSDALPRGRIKDARAWMSAALGFHGDCWSALQKANDTKVINDAMSFVNWSMGFTGDVLGMMISYDNFGNDTTAWKPPATERDGFWEKVGSGGGSELGFGGGFPSKLTADVTVCKDGSTGCLKTVQEAVNKAPDNAATKKFVIHIKAGVYEETVRVPLEKQNVVFLGDGMGKTVITGSLNVGQPEMSTYDSATVGVLGDGFMAKDITFQNTAGPPTHQAVAFRTDSDRSILQDCEFLSNQDTLYVHSLRQFFKSCRIQGNVDFIFGNSASVFQDCQIIISPRQQTPEEGENNAITANSRSDPTQSTALVFLNCTITGTPEYMALYQKNPKVHKNYLGRPWRDYARTVFIRCKLEALISPQGWMPFTSDSNLKALYYGEFENSGPGSNLAGRVNWSSQIPAQHVNSYSVQNFIQGNEWIPKP